MSVANDGTSTTGESAADPGPAPGKTAGPQGAAGAGPTPGKTDQHAGSSPGTSAGPGAAGSGRQGGNKTGALDLGRIFGKPAIMVGEDPAAYGALFDAVMAEESPQTAVECLLARDIVDAEPKRPARESTTRVTRPVPGQ
jgi:hypothetical protein